MSEQTSNTRSAAVRLASSINKVRTLPKAVYKANDAFKTCESLKRGENQSQ